jgi:hypothetical protein
MALTRQEIHQNHKDKYYSDLEFRKRVLQTAKRYHMNKSIVDPTYLPRRAEYNRTNAAHLSKMQKQHDMKQPFIYAFRRLKLRAKQNNLPFDLDAEYLVSIWTGNCAIFNTPLQLPYSTARQVPDKATVDRVVPTLGYTKGNIMWVSNRANIIKSYGTLEDHEAIVNYIKQHTEKSNDK